MPTPLFQKVVALIVLSCAFGIAVPQIAIALDVNVSLGAENGEVQAVQRFGRPLKPLPLRLNPLLLERGPETIFQRAAIVQIVDFDRSLELTPNRRDEHDASSPSAAGPHPMPSDSTPPAHAGDRVHQEGVQRAELRGLK